MDTNYHGGSQTPVLREMSVCKMGQFRPLPVVVIFAQFGGSTPTYGGSVVIVQQCVYRLYPGRMQVAYCLSTGRRRVVDRLHAGCRPAVDRLNTVCMQRVCSLYTDPRRIEPAFISLKRLGPVSAVRGPSALFLVGDLPAAFFKNQPGGTPARSFLVGHFPVAFFKNRPGDRRARSYIGGPQAADRRIERSFEQGFEVSGPEKVSLGETGFH